MCAVNGQCTYPTSLWPNHEEMALVTPKIASEEAAVSLATAFFGITMFGCLAYQIGCRRGGRFKSKVGEEQLEGGIYMVLH